MEGAGFVWFESARHGKSRTRVDRFFRAKCNYTLVTGARSYELSNHLGNVLAVVSDRGELQSAQDYFPFGMAMPGRSDGAYRYGFNGKETDPETGLYDFGARLYDGRLGRWLAVDPLAKKYPALTPYNFVGNMPLIAIDPDGKDIILITKHGGVKLGQETLMKTATGKALWEKYGKSTTDDIYITSQLFVRKDAHALTYKNIERVFVKDGKIQLDLHDKDQREFSTLNGMNVSRSKGRKIHLITLNSSSGFSVDNESKLFSKYQAAFTIFHEIKAHIDINKDLPADGKTEHELFGADHSPWTSDKWPTPNSPAEAMHMELLDLKFEPSKAEADKKAEVQKHPHKSSQQKQEGHKGKKTKSKR